MKKIILTFILAVASAASYAQLMTVNDQKTKFEATVEYRGGTPIDHNDRGKAEYNDFGNPEGSIYTHEGLWHNFIFSPMTKLGVEAHHLSNNGVGNGKGNHYFRVGMNASHLFMLPGYTRGINVTANVYAEGSQFGLHRFDGVLSSIFLFSMNPKDTRGVGFVWLLNNPQNMIGLPIFLLKKDFGKHWSINFMTWMADFTYHFNDKLHLSASYGFGFERFWYKPADEVLMDGQCMLTPSMSFKWNVSKRLALSVNGGGSLAFMNHIMNASGTELYDRRNARLTYFGSGSLSYNF